MLLLLLICQLLAGCLACETGMACEHDTLTISCASGEEIEIQGASYGRSDGTTCPHQSIQTTNCHSANSLAVVQAQCNGQQSCSVLAGNSVFGDPCGGTYKYLSVDYVCIKSQTACEGSSLSIKCDTGEKIEIHSASFGRHDDSTCPHTSIQTTNCHAASSLSFMQAQCDGQETCTVSATTSNFGDPCGGTYKYLQVQYKCSCSCTSASPDVHPGCGCPKVCEHDTLNLSCDEGEVLDIHSASYGRSDDTTCSINQPILTTSCHSSSSLSVVEGACEGQQSCSVLAGNSVFGDPCVGTFKYLKVCYSCVQKSVTCEHSAMNLACTSGEVIEINSASYGRHDGITCPHQSIQTTNCHSSTSLSVVQAQCDGEQTCSVAASNGVFGDPCGGTYKYLEVTHTCIPQTVVCEHETLNIECTNPGEFIEIQSASYGRSDGTTCPSQDILTTNCHATSSLGILQAQCNGQQSCSVLAGNSVFGDPCVGTFKYLSVNYKCVCGTPAVPKPAEPSAVCDDLFGVGQTIGYSKRKKFSSCRKICADKGLTCRQSVKIYPNPVRRARRGKKAIYLYNGTCKTIYSNACCCNISR